jgi:hypothetical protein
MLLKLFSPFLMIFLAEKFSSTSSHSVDSNKITSQYSELSISHEQITSEGQNYKKLVHFLNTHIFKPNSNQSILLKVTNKELTEAKSNLKTLLHLLDKFLISPKSTHHFTATTKSTTINKLPTTKIAFGKVNQSSLNTQTPPGVSVCIGGFSNYTKTNRFVCNKESSTNKPRPVYEVDCIFPFFYNLTWHDTCTNENSPGKHFWCSLDRIYEGRFAFCESKCPLLARNLVQPSQTHTSCLSSSKGAIPIIPTSSQIQTIVDMHNEIRSKVNEASNLRFIKWDQDVARTAQRKAETCHLSHDCHSCRTLLNNRTVWIGQNAYTAWNSGGYKPADLAKVWTHAIDSWSREIKDFTYGVRTDAMIGHYTQIVSDLVSRVGCGAAKCGK